MSGYKFRIFPLLAAALMLEGCIYPFTPDIPEIDGRLVVDGSLYIGEVSTVKLSYIKALSGYTDNAPSGEVWVEASDGTRYDPVSKKDTTEFNIDLTDAPDDLQYRLCVINKKNGHEYASEWSDVASAAVVDSLSYIPEWDKERMAIALSMHSSGNSYFRWSYQETWEYHSMYYADYYFVPSARPSVLNPGTVVHFEGGDNIYYCWGKRPSSEIMVFSTDNQTDDRFVDLEFHTIPQNDLRLQMLYHIEVSLEAISQEGYMYWNNMQKISEYQGSIFSPNPSEMRGNISGITDPDEFVAGYINVARRATTDLYIDNKETDFYIAKKLVYDEPASIGTHLYYQYYYDGYLPYTFDRYTGNIFWAEGICVDCRIQGGTKEKPEGWPTEDK